MGCEDVTGVESVAGVCPVAIGGAVAGRANCGDGASAALLAAEGSSDAWNENSAVAGLSDGWVDGMDGVGGSAASGWRPSFTATSVGAVSDGLVGSWSSDRADVGWSFGSGLEFTPRPGAGGDGIVCAPSVATMGG